jgi:hypothetical protein
MTKAANAVTAPALKLTTDVKKIEAMLTSIHRRGLTLQDDIHLALCSVLQHVGKHADTRLIDTAMAALPDMVRKQAVQKWFTAFGPVEFDGDDVMLVKGKATKLGDAMAMPFYKFNPKLDYVALTDEDIAGMIEKLAKRLKTDAKKTQRDHSAMIHALTKIKPANTLAA